MDRFFSAEVVVEFGKQCRDLFSVMKLTRPEVLYKNLEEAVIHGFHQVVDLILTDVYIGDIYSEHSTEQVAHLLVIAAQDCHPRTLKCLLKHGADPNKPEVDEGRRIVVTFPLHAVATSSGSGTGDIVSLLIHEGHAKVNTLGMDENTALHIAAEKGNSYTVEALLMAGADASIKNVAGKTAHDIAFSKADTRILQHLETYKQKV